MTDHPSAVAAHYGGERNPVEELLERLAAAGWSPEDGLASMPPVDELHIRGREATEELLAMAAPRRPERVLEVGSGLGGLARRLHAAVGCQVVGVDLTPGFCAAARTLSARLGLAEGTHFVCGSATALPVASGAFDLVVTQHAQMNIADKRALYGQIARALRPGGRFAYHDIFAGPGGLPRFPLPWASVPSLSALAPHERIVALLEGLGLAAVAVVDRTADSLLWARRVVADARAAESNAPPAAAGATPAEGGAPAPARRVIGHPQLGRGEPQIARQP